jgi:hypothetical protein
MGRRPGPEGVAERRTCPDRKVRNQSLGKERSKIKATELKVVDRRGRRIQTSVGFVSTFVRSLYPQNGRPGMSREEFPEAEQRRSATWRCCGRARAPRSRSPRGRPGAGWRTGSSTPQARCRFRGHRVKSSANHAERL